MVDGQGLPLVVSLSAGQRHESLYFESLVSAVRICTGRGRPRWRPNAIAGDKAYSNPRIRNGLRCHGIQAVIPQRSDEIKRHKGRPILFDRLAYRQRNVVERCVGWLKENRRVAVRYEKLAINYMGMIQLAMIQRYLQPVFSNSA